MLTLTWLLVIAAAIALYRAGRRSPHPLNVSWFDIEPYLTVSKKARGRGERAGRRRR